MDLLAIARQVSQFALPHLPPPLPLLTTPPLRLRRNFLSFL